MTYPIIIVPGDASTQLEQLGTKAKFWYRDDEGKSMLFKQGRPGTGENWAEKVCCEISQKLQLPHAFFELARCRGKEGVVTPNFVPPDYRLVHGNELLAKVIEGYDQTLKYSSNQHTLRRVIALLKLMPFLKAPLDWDMPNELHNTLGIFVGYLLLDALVGNQDRHHENWGVLYSPSDGFRLAPTFDHASSLGRNETDANRLDRLTSLDQGRSVEHYVTRARSGFYPSITSNKPYTTLEAFKEIAKHDHDAGRYWLNQLSLIQLADFQYIVSEVPDTYISGPARYFAVKMLEINQNRLLSLGANL